MKRIKNIRQHDTSDCGAACLCMICNYFGIEYSIQQMRRMINTRQNGVSILDLIEGAEIVGLSATSYKGDIQDLKEFIQQNEVPCILHLKNNHFVLLTSSKKDVVFINDPAIGCCKYTWEKIEQIWSGYIIAFNPTTDFGRQKKENKANILVNLLISNKNNLFFVCLLSIVFVAFTICSAYVFQLLIDYGGILSEMYEHNSSNAFIQLLIYISGDNIIQLLVGLICMCVVMAIVFLIRSNVVALMAKRIDLTLIDNYTSQIYNSTVQDVSARKIGDYISRISDLAAVRRMVTEVIVSFVLDIFMIVVSITILENINHMLFLVSLGMAMSYVTQTSHIDISYAP